METLCQVGNKCPLKPPNLYKGLHLFHVIMGCICYTFSIMALGTTLVLPDQMTPKNLTAMLWPWIFCGFTTHLLPCKCYIQRSEVCPAKEANLYMVTLYYQHNRHILLIWGRRTVTDLRLPSHDILRGCTHALGKPAAPPMWRPTDLVTQQPEIDIKKHLLSSVQHGTLLRPWPNCLRLWPCWAQSHGLGTTFFRYQLSMVLHLEPSDFFTGHVGLLKALNKLSILVVLNWISLELHKGLFLEDNKFLSSFNEEEKAKSRKNIKTVLTNWKSLKACLGLNLI